MFLAEHITHQYKVLTLIVPCWMEAAQLPSILCMLEEFLLNCYGKISHQEYLNDLVPRCLPSLHSTLWLLKDISCEDKSFSFLNLPGISRDTSNIYNKSLLVMLERMGWFLSSNGYSNNSTSANRLSDFLFCFFMGGLAWCTTGIHCSAFLELHHLHKALNHPVISKSLCHFLFAASSSM